MVATQAQVQRQTPPSANRYRAISALVAAAAAAAVLKAAAKGAGAMYTALFRYQVMGATLAERSIAQMLADQGADITPDADLVPTAFTTPSDSFEAMVATIEDEAEQLAREAHDRRIERLAESLAQEASRAAQQVAIAARPEVRWVRHLNLPSCSRCAVLAGRVYRYSQGFDRHPGCDCIMLPITVANPATYDPAELARDGQVTGLSKADMRALGDDADFGQIVNVRLKSAGLTESGQVLARAGRLTPAGIFDRAGDDRDYALELLRKSGYTH